MAAELWRHNSRAARCRYRAIWRLPVSGSSCPSLHMSTYCISVSGIISLLHFYRRVQKSVVLVLIWWECSAAYNIWIFSFRGEGKKSFINVGLSLPSPHIIMRGGFKRTTTFDYIFPLSLLTGSLISISSPWSQSSCPCWIFTPPSPRLLSVFFLLRSQSSQAGSTPYPARQ